MSEGARHRYFLSWPDIGSPPRELRGPGDEQTGVADVRYPLAILAKLDPMLDGPQRHFYLTKDPVNLPEYGPHVIAVLLQEERAKTPAYALEVGAVIRNLSDCPYLGFRARPTSPKLAGALLFEYARDWALRARSLSRVRRTSPVVDRPRIVRIPLGYQSQQELPQRPMAERTLDTFFAGDIATPFLRGDYRAWIPPSKTLARRELWRALADLRKNSEWRIELDDVRPDKAQAAASYTSYSERMMNSRICVAPRGSNWETYRFYEGLRAGCLVVTNPVAPEPFLRDAPVIIVDSWRELPRLLRRYARDVNTLEQYREAAVHWWRERLSEPVIARQLAQALNER